MNFAVEFQIEDPARPREPKLKRASKPKVRSGCKTCKKRRVKCDETWPSCKTCSAFRVHCEGYRIVESEGLLQKSHSRRQVFRRPIEIILDDLPMASLFQNEQEYQYYGYFQDHIASNFCVSFDPVLWNRVALQACNEVPALRWLLLSVTALYKAGKNADHLITIEGPAETSKWTEEALSDRLWAIKQYGKAIKALREVLEICHESKVTRIALIASLMIFCFEVHNEDRSLAVAHVRSALKLLQKRTSTSKRSYSHLQNKSPTVELEYELVAALIRLDTSLVGFAARIEGVDAKRQIILEFPYQGEKYEIPAIFTSVVEARQYYQHVETRVNKNLPYEFMAEMVKLPQTDYPAVGPLLPSDSIHRRMKIEYESWNTAFRPLFERIPVQSEEFLAACFLKIQMFATDLILEGLHLEESEWKDQRIEPIARKMLDLGRDIINDDRFHKGFSFDFGILSALSAIFFACRGVAVRKETIKVLRETIPRREGIWDSAKIVAACERMLDMEEKGTRKFTFGLGKVMRSQWLMEIEKARAG